MVDENIENGSREVRPVSGKNPNQPSGDFARLSAEFKEMDLARIAGSRRCDLCKSKCANLPDCAITCWR